jgi:hypothetical protein
MDEAGFTVGCETGDPAAQMPFQGSVASALGGVNQEEAIKAGSRDILIWSGNMIFIADAIQMRSSSKGCLD